MRDLLAILTQNNKVNWTWAKIKWNREIGQWQHTFSNNKRSTKMKKVTAKKEAMRDLKILSKRNSQLVMIEK